MTTGASPAEADGRDPGSDEPTGFVGRGGWHLVAFLAALALVLVMSIDWYTTEQGEEFRRVEDNAGSGRQIEPDLDERAAQAAENEEKTAWQADALIDRLILLACLIAFLGAVVAAFMRSAGRRPQPPWHPSAIATVAGVAGTLLILYRMFQPPGINDAAVIKAGAPLGLVAVGILTIGSRLAVLGEREEAAGPGAAAAPAGPPEGEGEEEAEAEGDAHESRWTRLRRRRGRGPAVAEPTVAEEEAEPSEGSGFEFDLPAAAPPDAEQRDEAAGVEPFEEPEPPIQEPEPLEEPAIVEAEEPPPEPVWEAPAEEEADDYATPVDERAVGAENPEEAPEWGAPDASTAEEYEPEESLEPESALESEPAPAEPVPDLILEDPAETAPVEEEPLDEEPFDEEPIDSGAVEEDVVEDDPVEDDPVQEPLVEEPPVDAAEEPLPLGEEIEFEYEQDSVDVPDEDEGSPAPDPGSRIDDPDEPAG